MDEYAVTLNLRHPEILMAILLGILDTGDVLHSDPDGRKTTLAVTVDNWLLDELAALGTDGEDLEAEPDEDDDPAEDPATGPAYRVLQYSGKGRRRTVLVSSSI